MSKRAHITLKTKLASSLCQMLRYDDDRAEYVPIIPHNEAKTLTEDEIISRFDWHHYPIAKAHGGVDAHHNLTPIPRADHKRITAKIDIPRIAKGKRITAGLTMHAARMEAKTTGELVPAPRRARKIPSRPFPKQHRPLRQGARRR